MSSEVSPGTALTVYVPDTLRGRAAVWASMPADARRREAMRAAGDHDEEALISLAIGYTLLAGRQHGSASVHTLLAYRAGVRCLLAHWREENILHPSPDAGDRYIAALSVDHAAGTCAARLAAGGALYRALRWARATGADPFAGVHAPRDRTPRHERRRPYSDVQVQAIAAACDDRMRTLVLLCAHAGLRIAEALALQWGDVNLAAGTLRVVSGKGRKARTVHLSATLAGELTAASSRPRAGTGPVIVREGGEPARDASWLRRRLTIACRRAGVPYLGFHALRHTAGTRLARETGNLQLVAAHLGHADVSTASIYAKWSDHQLADAVGTW